MGKQLLGLVSSSVPSGERRVTIPTIPTIPVSIANKRVEKSFNYYAPGQCRGASSLALQLSFQAPPLPLQLSLPFQLRVR